MPHFSWIRPARLRAAVSLVALLTPPAALAQTTEPLATDRPDFTEGPTAVPFRSAQLEFGATVDRTAGVTAVSGAELLARVGVARGLELRVGAPGYVSANGTSGVTAPSLGVKAELATLGTWDVGAIVEALLPVGSEPQSSRRLDPALIVTAARDLPGGADVGGQLGATYDVVGRRVGLAATLVGGLALSDRAGGFLELAADGLDASPALFLHVGTSYLLAPLVQVDVHGGVGLTGDAPAALLGAGLSIRR